MTIGTSGDECVACMRNEFLDPSIKMLVSQACGHRFCESCIGRSFVTKNVLPCPSCGTFLRRNQFIKPNADDFTQSSETTIRKRILKEFNRTRGDFPTLDEYNDYLEMVEDIIYNLANGTDTERMNQLIAKNRMENHELIIRNQTKRAEDEKRLASKVEEEKKQQQAARLKAAKEDQERISDMKKEEAERMHELVQGKVPAPRQPKKEPVKAEAPKTIAPVPAAQRQVKAEPLYRPGQTSTQVSQAAAAPAAFVQPKPLEEQPKRPTLVAARPSDTGDVAAMFEFAYKVKLQELASAQAGGYRASVVKRRAMNELLSAAFVFPLTKTNFMI
mmetsp:Transcript_14096/g.23329  ORF Transcript_14096/g.23329 Transcript_14096/m.23329 type:complete len:331 (-) Transcript_14096:30-1022(-)|eukprot:CAMPEP_0184671380 /NCGR_PEP_ID=MMETSP0308-20130426/85459_1 /TAXON_ID=38269 /ORGANISM="Gloeochaete witrockiana, Strain SAG 46.84" /LENGTH=330 /DNA_ID=CAMNT_0027118485 /DNA_START=38 /DNA_END=1030 /DNA_ORIENTATION=+